MVLKRQMMIKRQTILETNPFHFTLKPVISHLTILNHQSIRDHDQIPNFTTRVLSAQKPIRHHTISQCGKLSQKSMTFSDLGRHASVEENIAAKETKEFEEDPSLKSFSAKFVWNK